MPADKVQVSGMDTCDRHRDPRFRQVRLATREWEVGAVRSGPAGRSSRHWGRTTERRFGVRWEPAGRPSGASLCVAVCWEAGAGVLRARSVPTG